MDITFLLYLQQFRQLTLGILDSMFLYITTLGEDWILFLGTAGIYWCIDKRTGFFMYFNYNLANYVNQFVKLTACINRPWVRDSRVQPVGYRLLISQRPYGQGNGCVGRSGIKNSEMEPSDFPVFNWDCAPYRLFQKLSGSAYASGRYGFYGNRHRAFDSFG